MCKMNKKYWFFIDSHVHISIKEENVLFYNTFSGEILEYSREPIVLKLTRQLKAHSNLRVIGLKMDDLQNPVIKDFIQQIRIHFIFLLQSINTTLLLQNILKTLIRS